jgi:hypothetical protein
MTRTLAVLVLTIWAQTQNIPVTQIDNQTPAEVQMQLISEAAPPEVVRGATIYILSQPGFTVMRKGSNGFSCLIERDRRDILAPICYDAEGSATLLHADLLVEEARARGKSDDEIQKDVDAAYKSGKIKTPSKGGIVYMLSPHNRVLDEDSGKIVTFPGHLMFYAPYATPESVGTGKGAPFIARPGRPDALLVVIPSPSHFH